MMNIKGKNIGEGFPTYIIAEMSANHAGSYDRAVQIIHAAKEAGADCIKIQTYTPDTMTIDSNSDHFIVKNGTWKGENLYNLYKKAYTPWEWQKDLKKEADQIGIDFLSTPFDHTAVNFLEELDVDFYKIASFELVDLPLIKYIAEKQKPIIMSTGMASLGEIEEAINTIKSTGNKNYSILKCSSSYPAIPKDMNLLTIPILSDLFNVPVGLSDHTLGIISAIVAVSLGANIIEKHFCLSRKIKNPDSSFSMEPAEFKELVNAIRETETALGTVSFNQSKREKTSMVFRRSIFVVKEIKKGEVFTDQNIRIIRPGYGLLPKYYYDVLGKHATQDIKIGIPLNWDLIM